MPAALSSRCLACLSLLALVACDAAPPEGDGGPLDDAATSADAGPPSDAGPLVDAGPPSDAGPRPDAADLDAGPGETDGGGGDDAGVSSPVALLPADGAEVLYSAAVRVAAPSGAARVQVSEPVSGASCDALAPYFECLLDLSTAAAGPLTVELVALDGGDAELGRGSLALVRRAIEAPCTGDGAALTTCVLERADAGTSAGFAGVSYLNADDAHANVNTSAMTGIDARVLSEPPATVPGDVTLGLMNESRSWQPTGGWCSMPRCNTYSRQRRALLAYEANVLYFAPEHRDHGIRDYYQWQAPFFVLSQGSSSSERDEVTKSLRALGVMSTEARAAAVADASIAPLVSFLLVRARELSDADYLRAEAHPTALANAPSDERILELAAALRPGELPPVARIEVTSSVFPDPWATARRLDTAYAVGFAPSALPSATPAGDFEIALSLGASTDANGRALMFFPVVLRSSGSDVRLERTSADGLEWTVRGDFPEDEQLMTNGAERTVSRVTVAFFPHNGVWLGAPVMVSVGARPAEETAPNANNLD